MSEWESSSYDRINRALWALPEARRFREDLVRAMRKSRYAGYGFRLDDPGGTDKASAQPTWRYVYATDQFGQPAEHEVSSVSDVMLVASTVVTYNRVNRFVDENFGPNRQVKTFNCRKNYVKEGRPAKWAKNSDHKIQDSTQSFHEFVMERFRDGEDPELKAERERAEYRLRAAMIAVEKTEEYRMARVEAMRGFAKEAIKSVMCRFGHVDEATLREALDEYVLHGVMES